jgi:glyoxylase-like metal-dependent hydrolase (beta-lactamase superfamily II)
MTVAGYFCAALKGLYMITRGSAPGYDHESWCFSRPERCSGLNYQAGAGLKPAPALTHILTRGKKMSKIKKNLIIAGAVLAVIVLSCAILIVIGYNKYMTLETVQIDPRMKVYLGGGGNSVVLTSKSGDSALVVDAKMGTAAEKMRKQVSARDIIVVNTHAHMDHTSGNTLYPGALVIAGAYTKEEWAQFGKKARYPDEIVETGKEMIIKIDDETVHVRNMGAAHTSNDVVVYFENRKLLMTGDIVFLGMHPALFPEKGTVVGTWLHALDTLPALFAIEKLVPGHGPLSDGSALGTMKEYFTSIRDAIGNDALLDDLKNKKYKGYYSMPGMSGFDITVKTIADEMKKQP